MRKIIVIGALPSSLLNFRGALLNKLVESNCSVTAMASCATDSEVLEIQKLAHKYVDYPVSRNGLNPIKDLRTLVALINTFFLLKPDVILAYTIKPVIWGGLAAKFTRAPKFYALITGLGFAFQPGGFFKNLLISIVKFLYKYALKNSSGVIFQNIDNLNTFVDLGIVPFDKCHIVNGSGVNLEHFCAESLPKAPKFLLIARLLGDKGIREFYSAAKIVKNRYPNAEFHLVGPEDSSPDAINIEEVDIWVKSGVIIYHGGTNDVREFLRRCSIFVLPSYHEGMPRTVLEAMAMSRPILTTNVPGCRETVINGVNGWLVEKANIEQLADRMLWFIENPEKWQLMGYEGNKIAHEKFDVRKINERILNIMGVVNEEIF